MSIPLDEVISGDLHFLLYAFFFFFLLSRFLTRKMHLRGEQKQGDLVRAGGTQPVLTLGLNP